MKRAILCIGCITLGFGVGFGMALAFYWADNPSIIIQDRWRTVTTAPPVTYLPETPFHVDRKVICDPYVPPTTPTTRKKIPVVPPTQPPTTTTTLPIETTTTTVAP